MRHFSGALTLLSTLFAAFWTVVLAAGAADVDVPGTVQVGARPHANAVVWLETTSSSTAGGPRPVMDQRNLQFFPQVLAVRVGATVEFPNNDRVFHNVFSFRDGKRFDLGLYPIGAHKLVLFDRPGISRIFCNIHPHMAAYVVAVDSPYFAVSGADGTFRLRGVPEGTYTYHAWRAGATRLDGTVVVTASRPIEVRWP